MVLLDSVVILLGPPILAVLDSMVVRPQGLPVLVLLDSVVILLGPPILALLDSMVVRPQGLPVLVLLDSMAQHHKVNQFWFNLTR